MGVVRALIAEGGSCWRGQKGASRDSSRPSLLPFSFSLSPCPLSLVFVLVAWAAVNSRAFI